MMDFIILAEEEQLTNTLTPFQPQLDPGTMFMYAGIVISVVFAVLFIMYACISIASKIISKLPSGEKKAEPASAAPAPATAARLAERNLAAFTSALPGIFSMAAFTSARKAVLSADES